MSIELEYALEHKNDPAVLCCRMEPGEISHHNLEDPAIFPDLVDTGLLSLDGCLTIGQCIGATLKETSDSLTPLTAAIVDNIQDPDAAEEAPAEEAPAAEEAAPAIAVPEGTAVRIGGGYVRLYIAEGKDISIEFPV
ncbi:MAG: sugar transporter [Mogibacterium sp.]|jgi:D-proline reductase (dithiol) PrdA|nr:sugar transporter [Mogibacterium sp.]